MYLFAPHPAEKDFRNLAAYLMMSDPNKMHPALWPQRSRVAESLCGLSQEPEKQVACSAYHALRLFVW